MCVETLTLSLSLFPSFSLSLCLSLSHLSRSDTLPAFDGLILLMRFSPFLHYYFRYPLFFLFRRQLFFDVQGRTSLGGG